ncbi:MAG: hypothetical protein HDR10_03590 [Lachnospiraceae bacterium]|nr:hypothetical protein [Lachnospiraceae bacterium]
MIPIKIETILEGHKVEQNRIEYKEGFNLSEIVYTICGYANDIAGGWRISCDWCKNRKRDSGFAADRCTG